MATFLVFVVSTNPISPFEIDVDRETRQNARRAVIGDFGIPPAHADLARKAYEAARESFKTGVQRVPKFVWPAVVVAGAAVAIAAPFMVVLAAPAGLVGAAAITSGLAALGPGGMMGGLLIVGAMAGVGSLSAASAVMAPALAASTPDQVRQACTELMARALTAQGLNLDPHPGFGEWQILSAVLAQLANDLSRLTAVSDDDSHAVKDAKRKVSYVRHALDWMVQRGLGPAAAGAALSVSARPKRTAIDNGANS